MSPAGRPRVPPSPRWVEPGGGEDGGEGERGMESGPVIFAGVAFILFGGALLTWTGSRVRRREPVAQGVNQVASAALASVAGTVALALGVYCLTSL